MFASCARPMDQSEASRGCRGREHSLLLEERDRTCCFSFSSFCKIYCYLFPTSLSHIPSQADLQKGDFELHKTEDVEGRGEWRDGGK